MIEPSSAKLPAAADALPPLPPKGSGKRRGVKGRVLLALLLALPLIIIWLLTSEAGLVMSCLLLDRFSGGTISVAEARGSWWHGFTLKRLYYRAGNNEFAIQGVAVDWQPGALWQRELRIKRLDLGHVRVKMRQQTTTSAGEPSSLELPLDVIVNAISIASVTIEPSRAHLYGIAAQYHYRHAQHALQIQALGSAWGNGSASLRLAAQRPFNLTGRAHLRGKLESVPFVASANLFGSLLALEASGTAIGNTLFAQINGRFTPFAADGYIKQLALRAKGINPQAIFADFPQARLNINVQAAQAAGGKMQGDISFVNTAAGELTQARLPITSLLTKFTLSNKEISISLFEALLTQGKISASGHASDRQLDLRGAVSGVRLQALSAAAPNDTMDGEVYLRGTPAIPALHLALRGKWLASDAQIVLVPGRYLDLQKLTVKAGAGSIEAQGKFGLDSSRTFNFTGLLRQLDPSQFGSRWPRGDINATLQTSGQLAQGLNAKVLLQLAPSQLSDAPLHGRLQLELSPQYLTKAQADLKLGQNRMLLSGAFGIPNHALKISIHAPQLGLLGPSFAGLISGSVELSGTLSLPVITANLRAERLQLPGSLSLQNAALRGDLHADATKPFHLLLTGEGMRYGAMYFNTMRLLAVGTKRRHRVELDGQLQQHKQRDLFMLRVAGGFLPERLPWAWTGTLERLEIVGRLPVSLLAPMRIEASDAKVQLGTAQAALLGGRLALSGLTWMSNGELVTRGQITHLTLDSLATLLPLPPKQNLVLNIGWNLQLGEKPAGTIDVRRIAGDIKLPAPHHQTLPLGLRVLTASMEFGHDQAQWSLLLDSLHGKLHGSGNLLVKQGWPTAETAVAGNLQLSLPALHSFATYTAPDLELDGKLSANLTVSGPLDAIQLHGNVDGQRLLVADRRSGIRLSNGILSARLLGQRLELDQMRFVSGQGDVVASGALDLHASDPGARVRVILNRFSVFNQPSRQLVATGEAELTLVERKISLIGHLRADQGRIELARLGTPKLSDDVVVKGRTSAEPSPFAQLPLVMRLTLDMGERFRFTSHGLTVELTGQAQLTSLPGTEPEAHGQVRVVQGRYKAYGQDLDIEYGTITFMGPLDNPGLNIRARRRLSPVGAGVEVTGSVMTPQVRLIANTPMTDKDKLAWLVLGHAATSNSNHDDASMAAAAGAFLAGSLSDRVGLFDDLGMVQRNNKTLANGSVSPAEQVVIVGKQLTQEFYLGYEYGVSSARQAVKFLYQLSQNWSLVLRAGSESSAETRYTVRFD